MLALNLGLRWHLVRVCARRHTADTSKGEFDGLIVRSAVQVTREILEAGTKLRIIGRAGVGVDNIDTETATRRGVIVVNAPLGNVTSAAEHTFAMMLACARNVARGDGSMRAGKWDRKKLKGVELEGKTLGIVGLGKIGSRVAQFAKAFGMKITAFDPVLVKERAERLGVEMMDLDTLVAGADFITVHVPLSDRTRGMFGAERFGKMKKTARIVNTSRGGVIDEKALAEALTAGDIAGAALDVYAQEPPPEGHPLQGHDLVTMTPHLAASTAEAQWKVAVDVAEQFVDYFASGTIRSAVNIAALADPVLAPFMRLTQDLGGLAAQLAGGKVRAVKVTYQGEISVHDLKALTQSCVHGSLRPTLGDEVNVVNASVVARDAGIEVTEKKDADAGSYLSLVIVEVRTSERTMTVAGTIIAESRSGSDVLPQLVAAVLGAGLKIERIELREPDLTDVFTLFTGQTLGTGSQALGPKKENA